MPRIDSTPSPLVAKAKALVDKPAAEKLEQLPDEGAQKDWLKEQDAAALKGIGGATQRDLEKLGIESVYQFAQATEDQLSGLGYTQGRTKSLLALRVQAAELLAGSAPAPAPVDSAPPVAPPVDPAPPVAPAPAPVVPAPVAPPAPVDTRPESPLRNLSGKARDAITGNTGPWADPLMSRSAQIGFDIPPGSEFRVVNWSRVDRDGKPFELAKGTIPMTDAPPFMGDDFRVRKDLQLGNTNWSVGEHVAVFVKRPGQEESRPAFIKLEDDHGRSWHRSPEVHQDRCAITDDGAGGKVFAATADRAVQPFQSLTLYKNGIRTGTTISADENGRFSLPIPPGLENDALTLVADNKSQPVRLLVQNANHVEDGATFLLDRCQRELRSALMHAAAGPTSVTLTGLPAGFTLNVAAGGQNHSFSADDSGKLVVALPQLAPGGRIDVSSAEVTAFEGGTWATARSKVEMFRPLMMPDNDTKGSGRDRGLSLKLSMPILDDAGRARMATIAEALPFTNEANLATAWDLFGPNSPFPALQGVNDKDKIARIYVGFQLGYLASRIRSAGYSHSGRTLDGELKKLVDRSSLDGAGKNDVLEGMRSFTHYFEKRKRIPRLDENVQAYQHERSQPGRTFDRHTLHRHDSPERFTVEVNGPAWLTATPWKTSAEGSQWGQALHSSYGEPWTSGNGYSFT